MFKNKNYNIQFKHQSIPLIQFLYNNNYKVCPSSQNTILSFIHTEIIFKIVFNICFIFPYRYKIFQDPAQTQIDLNTIHLII